LKPSLSSGPTVSPDPPVHFPAINSLRGIAILMVLAYHLFHFTGIFEYGWMGVDLFFVLSGFLITNILLQQKRDSSFFRNFYRNRVLRIFPVYYVTLIAFFLLANLLFNERDAASTYNYYKTHQAWFWTNTQNWLFIIKGSPEVPYLKHFWSIAIEEQFYLFWPFLVFSAINKFKLVKISICLMVFALLLRATLFMFDRSHVESYTFNTFARTDGLMGGAVLAILLPGHKKQLSLFCKVFFITGILFFIISLFIYGSISRYNMLTSVFGYTFISLFFTSAVYYVLTINSKLIQTFARFKLFHFFARYSYCIYVIHVPIYLAIITKSEFLAEKLSIPNNQFVLSAITLILVIVISMASYHLMEKHFLKLKRHSSKFTKSAIT
jgi:peptidoglycan/LPS O-acetylase OafA/YrhL